MGCHHLQAARGGGGDKAGCHHLPGQYGLLSTGWSVRAGQYRLVSTAWSVRPVSTGRSRTGGCYGCQAGRQVGW